jgi:hypothetical protein
MKHLLANTLVYAMALLLSACGKEPLLTDWDLSEDDKLWIPYSGTGFQSGKNFRDETGYVHHLNLLWEATAEDKFGSRNETIFADRDVEYLCFGRNDICMMTMIKKETGFDLDLSFTPNVLRQIRLDNTDLFTTVDTINLWGNEFYDVFVFENNISASWSGPCARVYMQKGAGIIAVEYRDGRYYVLE